jgi:hypothetical protein
MEKVSIIAVDLAKHVFQVHGACADGSVAFRKKISRVKFLSFCRPSRSALWRWKPALVRTVGA